MRALTITVVVALLFVDGATANDTDKHGPSTANASDHTFERAGMPLNISCLAVPSVGSHEGPGYIGGGKLIGGQGRGPTDGTFGFDYQGFGWHPGRVFLGWAHDLTHQPKLGSYKTDTHNVPDVLSLTPVRRVFDENKVK